MDKVNKKIVMGENVRISQKNGEVSEGMVRSILRDFKGEVIVELFNGAVGRVIKLVPKRPVVSIKKSPVIVIDRDGVKRNEKELFSGERKDVEYKLSALWSQNLTKDEIERSSSIEVKKYGARASKIILAKVIAGFLNSSGGDLVIGIREDKGDNLSYSIVGVQGEFSKLRNKDFGEDGYRRMIMDDVIRPYFPANIFNHFNHYFNISFLKKEGKILCRITIGKSNSEVFIKIGNDDYFFIRVDTQTRELKGKEIIDYIRRRF